MNPKHLKFWQLPIISIVFSSIPTIWAAEDSLSDSAKTTSSEELAITIETGLILDQQRIQATLSQRTDNGAARRTLMKRLLDEGVSDRSAAIADYIAKAEIAMEPKGDEK